MAPLSTGPVPAPGPRRALLASLAALTLAACGDAPEPDRTQAPPAAAPAAAAPARETGPRLEFTESVHDFGSASDIGSLKHAFAFENTGDRRLIITEIKASCGCTATSLDKKVFDPGEGERIEVDWHPKGFGKQRKSITVQSNSAGAPLSILYIDAEIEPFVRVEPTVVSFGRVRLGEQHLKRAKLLCADPELLVDSVVSPNPHFAAQVVPGDDGGLELEVVLRPTAPWGQAFTSLQIEVVGRPTPDAEPVAHKLTVGANARVFGEVEIDPAMFGVGRVEPGASFSYEVRVVRDSSEPFQILQARVDQATPPTMSVRSEPLPSAEGNGYKLVLEGEAGDHLGTIRAQVRFTTDVPGEGERSLAVMGIVRALGADGH